MPLLQAREDGGEGLTTERNAKRYRHKLTKTWHRHWTDETGRKCQLAEHIWVWKKHHGPIPKGQKVHHVNFDRSDNRVSNLILLDRKEFSRTWSLHRRGWDGNTLLCPCCGTRRSPNLFPLILGKWYGQCEFCRNEKAKENADARKRKESAG